jgi:hypothetical protein
VENVKIGDEVLVFDKGDWKRPVPRMRGGELKCISKKLKI